MYQDSGVRAPAVVGTHLQSPHSRGPLLVSRREEAAGSATKSKQGREIGSLCLGNLREAGAAGRPATLEVFSFADRGAAAEAFYENPVGASKVVWEGSQRLGEQN